MTLMNELAARWESFKDERGASMVEYALLVVLIAIIAILAITFAGEPGFRHFQRNRQRTR